MAAIYQWIPKELVILTTTLYPVEVTDSMQFACDITYGEMRLIPDDDLDFSNDLVSVSMVQILLSTPAEEDDLDFSNDVVTAVLAQILISTTPEEDDLDISNDVAGVELESKLIVADTPDEELQLACDINPSNCSMTAV